MMYDLLLNTGGITDVGQVRSKNEDSILILDKFAVYCVADGMGGAIGGDVASGKTVELIETHFTEASDNRDIESKLNCIVDAANESSNWIYEWALKNEVKGTGTTLVSLVISEESPWCAYILHAGDSRAYRLRDGSLKQISKDHSIEEAVGANDGQELPSQFRGLITRAIGLKRNVSLEITFSDQHQGDIWLLCSDGLTKMVGDDEIAEIIQENITNSVETIADLLVDRANALGGRDNISAVIVKVDSCSPPPEGEDVSPIDLSHWSTEPETENLETDITDAVLPRDTTDASDLVSIQTPLASSEETLLKEDLSTKRSWIIKVGWIAIPVLCVVLGSLLFLNGNKRAAQVPVEQGASRTSEPTEIVPEKSSVPYFKSTRELVQYAKQTGAWNTASKVLLNNPDLIQSESDKDLKEQVIRWQVIWEKASLQDFNAVSEINNLIHAHVSVLNSMNVSDVFIRSESKWSSDPAQRANEYCLETLKLQKSLISSSRKWIEGSASYLDVFEDLSPQDVSLAEGNSPISEREELREAKRAIGSFKRWLLKNENYPISASQISQIPGSYIRPVLTELENLKLILIVSIRDVSTASFETSSPSQPSSQAVDELKTSARDLRNYLERADGNSEAFALLIETYKQALNVVKRQLIPE